MKENGKHNIPIKSEKKNSLMGYLSRVKASKLYFILRRNLVLIPTERGNNYLLLKIISYKDGFAAFLCSLCDICESHSEHKNVNC